MPEGTEVQVIRAASEDQVGVDGVVGFGGGRSNTSRAFVGPCSCVQAAAGRKADCRGLGAEG